MRSRYTDPVENLRTWLQIKGGTQMEERISDLQFLADKIRIGDELIREIERLGKAGAASDSTKIEEAIRAWKEM